MWTAGGKAVAAVVSAEDGDAIVKTALDAFGGVHVLVANAGVVRPNAFEKMTDQEWDEVMAVHLRQVIPLFGCTLFDELVTIALHISAPKPSGPFS